MRKLAFALLAIVVQLPVVFSQEITTTNVYTLKEGERILFEDEYSLRMYNNENTSIIFTKRDDGHYFIFNGEEMGPWDTIYYPGMYDYEEHGRFQFSYEKDGKYYFNLNGENFGPYHKLGGATVNPDGYTFSYQREDEKWMVNVNGKEFGPFEGRTYGVIKGDNIAYVVKEAKGRYFVHINDTKLGPYQQHVYVSFSDNGAYKYSFKRDDKYYYNYNGKELGPFKPGYYPKFDEDGKMIGKIDKSDGQYLRVNGKDHGPYGKIRTHQVSGSHFAVVYYKDFKYHVVVDGKLMGSYSKIIRSINIDEKGKYLYYYTDDDKQEYMNVNGKIYGPYEDVHGSANGKNWYMVRKEADGKYHLLVNGKEKLVTEKRIYPRYDKADNLTYSYMLGEQHYYVKGDETYGPSLGKINPYRGGAIVSRYKKGDEKYFQVNGKEYKGSYRQIMGDGSGKHFLAYHYYRSDYNNVPKGIMIDGKEFPDELGFTIWFDKEANSFRWITLEGRSIVMKEYKLN